MTVPSMMEIDYTEYGMKLYDYALQHQIPISGGIEITHRCNLRCVHCYVASDHYPKELTTAQWFQVIDQIAAGGCFWFYITGGEAMIRPDFLEIYLHAKRCGMSVVVLSNATCVSERIADTLAEYPPQCVEVSMYGATEETFDRVGKVKFGFRRFLKGMELFLDRGIKVKMKTMALKENVHEIPQIRQFAKDRGLSFRYDAVINARVDRKLSPLGHGLSADEIIALEKADPDKEIMWGQFCSNHMGGVKNDQVYQCGAGRTTFNVDPYGRLSVCMLSRRPNYPILAGSFLEGWRVGIHQEVSRKRQRDSACTSCDVIALCGNCTGFYDLYSRRSEEVDLPAPEQQPVEMLCDLGKKRAEVFGKKEKEVSGDSGG